MRERSSAEVVSRPTYQPTQHALEESTYQRLDDPRTCFRLLEVLPAPDKRIRIYMRPARMSTASQLTSYRRLSNVWEIQPQASSLQSTTVKLLFANTFTSFCKQLSKGSIHNPFGLILCLSIRPTLLKEVSKFSVWNRSIAMRKR
jgi:hypothetical protein